MHMGSIIIRRCCILTWDRRYNLLHVLPAIGFSTEEDLYCANRLTPEEDEQKFEPKMHEDFCFYERFFTGCTYQDLGGLWNVLNGSKERPDVDVLSYRRTQRGGTSVCQPQESVSNLT